MSAQRPLRDRSDKEDKPPSPTNHEAVFWRATYTYQAKGYKYTDEASIRDVSRNGCGMRGRACLTVGTKTTVTFYLEDRQRPLSVAARVIWVTGELFGVEFLRLSADDYERMQRYAQPVMTDTGGGVEQLPVVSKNTRKPNLRLAVVSVLALGCQLLKSAVALCP
jgi:PilZ domain-containing protein